MARARVSTRRDSVMSRDSWMACGSMDGARRGAARRVPRDAVTRVMGVMCVHKNNNAAGGDRLRVHVEDVFVGVGAGGGRRGTRARAARRARRDFPTQETPVDGSEEWVGFNLLGAV